MKFNFTIFIFVIGLLSLLLINGVFAVPNGASTITDLGSSSAVSGNAGNASAIAGNVTGLDVIGYSTTQTWQGYYGNVSGTIQLADASNNVLYNWTLASPSGEIYASTNSSIQWVNTQCFNFTALGNYSAADNAQAGSTSLYGTNLTQLESVYNIAAIDADGINETFVYTGGSGHTAFNVGSLAFATGECPGTRVYDSTGAGTSGNFEEALLYEPASTSVIFASILEKNLNGFNARTHDFEMLVLEDGHGVNVATTPYYFFVELQ